MKKITYNKLIRDRIPEIIKADGRKPVARVLGKDEFKKYLIAKIGEEASELVKSTNNKNIIVEIIDLLEIIDNILKLDKVSWPKLRSLQKQKRLKRGGFKKQLFLKYVLEK